MATLLFAIAISIWPMAIACIQTPAANPLPASSRAHLIEDRFGVVTSVRGLPLGVRDGLQTLFQTPFLEIAEPGAAFRATDVVVDPSLPIRRLVFASCSIDHCIVYYERGGIAHSWYVALFHWTPAETRFEWGGVAPSGVRTIEDLQKAVLSGTLKASGSW